jgi:hypothetical protein
VEGATVRAKLGPSFSQQGTKKRDHSELSPYSQEEELEDEGKGLYCKRHLCLFTLRNLPFQYFFHQFKDSNVHIIPVCANIDIFPYLEYCFASCLHNTMEE